MLGVEELQGREGDFSGDSYWSAQTTGQRGAKKNSNKNTYQRLVNFYIAHNEHEVRGQNISIQGFHQ